MTYHDEDLTALDGPEVEDLLDALDFEDPALADEEDESLAMIGLDTDGLYPRPGVRRQGRGARVLA